MNWQTALLLLALVAVVGLIVAGQIKKRKSGGCCGCSGCSCSCHKKEEKE